MRPEWNYRLARLQLRLQTSTLHGAGPSASRGHRDGGRNREAVCNGCMVWMVEGQSGWRPNSRQITGTEVGAFAAETVNWLLCPEGEQPICSVAPWMQVATPFSPVRNGGHSALPPNETQPESDEASNSPRNP